MSSAGDAAGATGGVAGLDMMLEISEKIRQEVGIDEVDVTDVSEIDADITLGEEESVDIEG